MTGGGAFRFALDTSVEIADTDLGGVVYFGSYPRLLDRGLLAYRRHLGHPRCSAPRGTCSSCAG